MSLVQGFDGLIGALAGNPAKTFGPFIFAAVNVAALVWLMSEPAIRETQIHHQAQLKKFGDRSSGARHSQI
jgi:hypothetical protein